MEPQHRSVSTLTEKFNRRMARMRGRTIAIVAAAAVLSTGLIAGCRGKSVNDYLREGDAAMQRTDLGQAEENYQAAVKAAPGDPRVHVALGNLYVFEQKPTLAQAEFVRVLELEPANPAAHSALGGLYESAGQMGAAEEQYLAAVALKPTDPVYRLQLGALLAKNKRQVRAEVELRTAIGLQPKNAQAHLALANLLNANPDTRAEAEAEFAEVRALDPHLLAEPVRAAPEAPGTAPGAATAAAPPPTTPAVKEHKLKPIDRKFKLTKNSPVYQAADGSTSVVGQVHRGHFVHVTGIAGDWLQVTLRNGTVGYIPVAAAE
ncbi:MAG TPA: tetratricopeptide repeat protein [Candidatus Binataceae bacterium]|nr:tetratricopeptide repeat protein [Candidatus Binataceae bacterium]